VRRGFGLATIVFVFAASVVRAQEAPPTRASLLPVDAGRARFGTVVIDAGHGGEDHGAEGPDGLLEKDVVLEVAQRLAEQLRGEGLRVVLTRDRDVAVALQERTRIANDAGGELFVSVHANAAPSRAARGMETYFLSLDASDEASGRMAAQENEAFGNGVSAAGPGADPLAAILGDLTSTGHLADSDEFARLVHGRLAAIDAVPSRGVKQAPFVVLMGVKMPAALIEIGFITNAREARGLAGAERQDALAGALAGAVLEFGRRQDARRGETGEGGS
jgi:N-acetylmuramoyl-L-alanine amidase